MVVTILLSMLAGFIAGALVFRNNEKAVNSTIKKVDDIKKIL